MLEMVMLSGIGFLTGCLLVVAFVPAIHNRAVRLTARHYLAKMPMSMAELEAQKDLLRAEFAMSIRRLETIVEETKAKSALQLSEIGRKAAEIHRLKAELGRDSTPDITSRFRAALARAGWDLDLERQHDAA
jgi:uncharacterized protein YaiL (DUF2058 family)